VRLKIYPTLTDREGHKVKYLQPRAAPPRLYFPPATLRAVLEGDAPGVGGRGAKKGPRRRAAHGLPAIGSAASGAGIGRVRAACWDRSHPARGPRG
jgi:hypothetical protein